MTDLAETGSRIGQERANRLAIDGGAPVRREPLPWELPGVHWIGEEERELVDRVVRARSPFRFYGPDPQHMVETLERVERIQVPGATTSGLRRLFWAGPGQLKSITWSALSAEAATPFSTGPPGKMAAG